MFSRPYRWAVLGAYAVVIALSQLLWLNFAPLLSMVQTRYGVGELAASGLVLAFPLLYVVFSIPAGKLIDRRGYRFAVGLGALLMTAAASIRINDSTFYALLAGQIGIAIAQPFIVNGISKLVSDWFTPQQGVLATGLGTMGMFVGMAVGMASTPPLVEATSLRTAMIVFAAIAAAATAIFFAVVRPNDQAPKAEAAAEPPRLFSLFKTEGLPRLFALGFLGMGEFTGLTTWLEQILAPHGIRPVDAGLIGGVLITGGIVGAVIIPMLSDKLGRRKPFLLLCVGGALATLYPLCTGSSVGVAMVLAGIHGFCFMPAFALLLDMVSQLAGQRAAGAATSLLMLSGNAGGVLVIVAMPLVKGDGPSFTPSVFLLISLLTVGGMLAMTTRETSRAPAVAVPS